MLRRRGLVTLLVALAVAGGSTSLSAPASAEEQFTPLLISVMSKPSWFRSTDGLVHLAYELEMRNAFPVNVTVDSVEVRDENDAPVQTLAGDDLLAAMSLLPIGDEPTTVLAPSEIGVVWFDVPFERARDLPRRITHVLTVSPDPGLPVPDTIVETGAPAKVGDGPVVIRAPLTGPGWLSVGSCCDGPHRRSAQPINGKEWLAQRFAIDFNRLNDADFLAAGDPSLNESWFTYGQPVIAVADATVVKAVDGLPDQIPDDPEPVTIEEADGNFVILKLRPHVFAFYAHLRPGTVAVAVGDRVTRGDVIGDTGNSGSSTGPHLHFQLMDRPSGLKANGVPYVFNRFDLEGQSPPLEELLNLDPVNDPVPITPTIVGPQRKKLPRGADLAEFPG